MISPDIHLAYAQFQEAHGHIDEARSTYQYIQDLTPGLLEAVVKFSAFELRNGNPNAARELLEARNA